MSSNMRFGRRVALPSTAAIKHDLRLLMSLDRIESLKKELREYPDADVPAGPAGATGLAAIPPVE